MPQKLRRKQQIIIIIVRNRLDQLNFFRLFGAYLRIWFIFSPAPEQIGYCKTGRANYISYARMNLLTMSKKSQKVQNEISIKVKYNKYSIITDSTPDTSYADQLCLVL